MIQTDARDIFYYLVDVLLDHFSVSCKYRIIPSINDITFEKALDSGDYFLFFKGNTYAYKGFIAGMAIFFQNLIPEFDITSTSPPKDQYLLLDLNDLRIWLPNSRLDIDDFYLS